MVSEKKKKRTDVKDNPSVRTRWKPGECGNYAGRPKGAVGLKQKIKKFLKTKVPVQIGGKVVMMMNEDFIIMVQGQAAKKGDLRAANWLIDIGGIGDADDAQPDNPADDKELVAKYVAGFVPPAGKGKK